MCVLNLGLPKLLLIVCMGLHLVWSECLRVCFVCFGVDSLLMCVWRSDLTNLSKASLISVDAFEDITPTAPTRIWIAFFAWEKYDTFLVK